MPFVPAIFVPATIVAPLKSSVASSGMLSRMVLKSRASMVPVTVRLVIVAKFPPAAAMAVANPPAVTPDTLITGLAKYVN